MDGVVNQPAGSRGQSALRGATIGSWQQGQEWLVQTTVVSIEWPKGSSPPSIVHCGGLPGRDCIGCSRRSIDLMPDGVAPLGHVFGKAACIRTHPFQLSRTTTEAAAFCRAVALLAIDSHGPTTHSSLAPSSPPTDSHGDPHWRAACAGRAPRWRVPQGMRVGGWMVC